jgi:hypothetical protein
VFEDAPLALTEDNGHSDGQNSGLAPTSNHTQNPVARWRADNPLVKPRVSS